MLIIRRGLTFIVDSDDKLTDDAVVAIKKVYHKYQDEKDICGFSFLRGKPDGGYLSDSGVPKNGMKESYVYMFLFYWYFSIHFIKKIDIYA